MAINTEISWAHHSQNFWMGCDRVAPECAKCYIHRVLGRKGLQPWGEIYQTQTWGQPITWNREAERDEMIERVFTCSLSDFFHVKADAWRPAAWNVIRQCQNLVWLVLTKRPERIARNLPPDWPNAFPNVWLGVSAGSIQSLNKLDTLRRIPVHPRAHRWVSTEPLLQDISRDINLDGFSWLVTGGESGSGEEYLWNPEADWRKEFSIGGRRTMRLQWALNLRDKCLAEGKKFMFKQIASAGSSYGVNALGRDWHQYPDHHLDGCQWRPQPSIPAKYLLDSSKLTALWQKEGMSMQTE